MSKILLVMLVLGCIIIAGCATYRVVDEGYVVEERTIVE